MIKIPKEEKDIIRLALELVEQCRSSIGSRASYYRSINAIAETGNSSGQKALLNLMNVVLGRTAGHIYDFTNLRFSMEFDNEYDSNMLSRGTRASRQVTNNFRRTRADMLFGRGVFEALKYGCVFMKQWPQREGKRWNVQNAKQPPKYNARIVMPWQFGVYREDVNDLADQSVLCETLSLIHI